MIKKVSFITLIALFFFINGCSDSNTAAQESSMPYSVENLEILEWNEYEFMQNIPQPDVGNISSVSVLHCTEENKYNIIIDNINSKESDLYIEKLKKHEYKVIESASNNISTGTILSNGNTHLSISYSDGVMGMLINIIND